MKSQKNRKVMTVALTLLVVTGIPMVIGGLNRLWDRQFEPVTFYFEYINFEGFACNNWQAYQDKIPSLALLNGMTMITVTENTYSDPLFMDISFTSTASGAGLTCWGRYVQLYYDIDLNPVIEPVPSNGDPFIIPTNGDLVSLDLAYMDWSKFTGTGTIGYAIELTFTAQTGGITETASGDYSYTVSVGIGTDDGA